MPFEQVGLEPGTADPPFIFGQMRVQNMPGMPFFFVCTETTMDGLSEAIDRLMPLLVAARDEGGVTTMGPLVMRYLGESMGGAFRLEAGYPVAKGTQPAGEAQVATLPPFPCASLLYSGGMDHLSDAYDLLMEAIEDAGLQHVEEAREWYLYFEEDDSPNNVTLIQLKALQY
ncbi:MAG: GyrI-like domain-containing protein [Anaerolineae bacterium]